MTAPDLDWRLVREEAHEGPTNMALDEVAAETAATDGVATLRVYRWEPSTLSLGYHQEPETVDWDYCAREGITVTRRPTGGGGIYHDRVGDISYSIVAPAAALPGDLMEAYDLLCTPLLAALRGLGVPAEFADEERPAIHPPACYLRALHPAHDVVSAVDGRKLSGNAQYRRRDSVIQHGSVVFDHTVDRHLSVFADSDLGARAYHERVTSVVEHADVAREDAVGALEDALEDWAGAAEGTWTAGERDRAAALVESKYGTDAWTRRGAAPE